MSADKRQIGGDHYKTVNPDQEHWNLVIAYEWDYFTAQVIKYMMRWTKKGGVDDLRKAQHFLEKLIEVVREEESLSDGSRPLGRGYVDQDR